MNKPLVMLGGGGHASVLADILISQGATIIAVVTPHPINSSSLLSELPRINQDECVPRVYSPDKVDLVNGIGALPNSNSRNRVFDYFAEQGYYFPPIISSNALISKYSNILEGVQVMPGVIIQPNAEIKINTIINTGVIIEHDCKIGEHNHIAPGAVLSGGVITESYVHIGTGATIIQGVCIRSNAIIGAGTTIARNVPQGRVLIPARSRVLKE